MGRWWVGRVCLSGSLSEYKPRWRQRGRRWQLVVVVGVVVVGVSVCMRALPLSPRRQWALGSLQLWVTVLVGALGRPGGQRRLAGWGVRCWCVRHHGMVWAGEGRGMVAATVAL